MVEVIYYRRFFDFIGDGVEVVFQYKYGGGQSLRYYGDDQCYFSVVNVKCGDDFEKWYYQ